MNAYCLKKQAEKESEIFCVETRSQVNIAKYRRIYSLMNNHEQTGAQKYDAILRKVDLPASNNNN